VPVEAKPLFRPDVLRSHLSGFAMPAVDASKLGHWASLIASGRIDGFREQEILREFLSDAFVGLLGYTGPAAGHDRYTIRYERHVEVDGKYADAVLGDFNGHHRYVVAIEGKGPRDAPGQGRCEDGACRSRGLRARQAHETGPRCPGRILGSLARRTGDDSRARPCLRQRRVFDRGV
jgi:hypothetical protein